MVLKSLKIFAQQVSLVKKPVQTFLILAFLTNICELIEYYVKSQLGTKMEGPLLFLALLVRNILQSMKAIVVLENNFLIIIWSDLRQYRSNDEAARTVALHGARHMQSLKIQFHSNSFLCENTNWKPMVLIPMFLAVFNYFLDLHTPNNH